MLLFALPTSPANDTPSWYLKTVVPTERDVVMQWGFIYSCVLIPYRIWAGTAQQRAACLLAAIQQLKEGGTKKGIRPALWLQLCLFIMTTWIRVKYHCEARSHSVFIHGLL